MLLHETPPIHVRALYASSYAKQAKTASAAKYAKELAYKTVEKKYGPEMRDLLKRFHDANAAQS